MTHRFHPLFGRSFEFVKRCKTWQSDRVYFFDDAGELASVPAEWTDVVPADPFVVVSAGRSPFRVADLLVLADLVGVLGAGSGTGAGVSRGLCRDSPGDSAGAPVLLAVSTGLPERVAHFFLFVRMPGGVSA